MAENFELYAPGPGLIDGDMTAKMHDADGIENNVLHAGLNNTIFVRWHLEGPDVPIIETDCRWHLEAHFESIGHATHENVEPEPVDIPYGDGNFNGNFVRWNASIQLPAGIYDPGVYKAVVLISFQRPETPGSTTYVDTNMSGFFEIPMIRFTNQ